MAGNRERLLSSLSVGRQKLIDSAKFFFPFFSLLERKILRSNVQRRTNVSWPFFFNTQLFAIHRRINVIPRHRNFNQTE